MPTLRTNEEISNNQPNFALQGIRGKNDTLSPLVE